MTKEKPAEMRPEGGLFGEKRADESWKEKAQREKERLAAAAAEEVEREAVEMPPASFGGLLEELVLRAMIGLGQLVDPASSEPPAANLPSARHSIDMLGVLEEKTRGDLSAGEVKALGDALHSLRMAFVHVSHTAPAASEPGAGPLKAPGRDAGPDAGADPKKPRIIL